MGLAWDAEPSHIRRPSQRGPATGTRRSLETPPNVSKTCRRSHVIPSSRMRHVASRPPRRNRLSTPRTGFRAGTEQLRNAAFCSGSSFTSFENSTACPQRRDTSRCSGGPALVSVCRKAVGRIPWRKRRRNKTTKTCGAPMTTSYSADSPRLSLRQRDRRAPVPGRGHRETRSTKKVSFGVASGFSVVQPSKAVR